MSATHSDAVHLWNRLGFGPGPGDVERLRASGSDAWIAAQLSGDASEAHLEAALAARPGIDKSIAQIIREHQEQNQSREPIERALTDLRSAKLIRAVASPNQLREVMVDFWFNHFNVYAYAWEPSLPAYEKEAIRPHALGRFRELLGAVARHPAMMFFLDTYTNVADRIENGETIRGINENFARELLELHTVGVDAGYTQADITDAARALTGWTIAGWGTAAATYVFEFRADRHDWGAKRVFGLSIAPSGEAEGDELLDYLSSHPATARFLATKLVQRFVADDPPASLIDRVASRFLAAGGDIRATLEAIFDSPEFHDPAHRANKFKTPFEFVASALRATGSRIEATEELLDRVEGMGMPLYEAKPPTGYAIPGRAWMNPSSQVFRFDFALSLAAAEIAGIETSPAGRARRRPVTRTEESGDRLTMKEEILALFDASILGEPLGAATRDQVSGVAASGELEDWRKALGLLLASPEFAAR